MYKPFLITIISSFALAGNPNWHHLAVWYQIFPDRFYNGDQSNDPTMESLIGVWPWDKQSEWAVSPWTSDWYEFQPWEIKNDQDYRYQFQLRRYGGDIQGIIQKLDYLQQLGINAIYLNPVFDSPSSHKYGAAYYHHIDRHFGPDPKGDAQIIASENPNDPSSWIWTSADKLFLKLVQEVHKRDMHIIIDGVFNHVGMTFWAFQDVIKNKDKSPYIDWFVVEGRDKRDLSHNKDFVDLPPLYSDTYGDLRYKGWVTDLPSFRQDSLGPVEPVRNHLHDVVKRWMDPNNDGDPSDGIDGWRLDVAERVQIGFWTLFGGWVRDINPDAYLTGEVWWEDWPKNKMYNALPWMVKNRLTAVMNYRFGDAMYKFFIDEQDQISPNQLDALLNGFISEYGHERSLTLQNMFDSHDTERLASAVVNPDRWIDHENNTWYQPLFDIRKPNENEWQTLKTMVTFQYIFPGTPFIYYGNEVGMWGADDPDCRKPMIWEEFNYNNEKAHQCDRRNDCDGQRPSDPVEINTELFNHYKQLNKLKSQYNVLNYGDYKTVYTDQNGLYIFSRSYDDQTILAIFNGAKHSTGIPSSIWGKAKTDWTSLIGKTNQNNIKGKSGYIFIHEN